MSILVAALRSPVSVGRASSMSLSGTALGGLLADRSEDARPALLYEDRSWSYRDLVAGGLATGALFAELRDPERPPHVGVLLDNVPDYLFWLTAGALSGTVVVGSTRPTAASSWPS